MTGKRITTLQQLRKAMLEKRSVVCPSSHVWHRPRPAAFIINLSGQIILQLFGQGLWLYQPNKKRRAWKGETR